LSKELIRSHKQFRTAQLKLQDRSSQQLGRIKKFKDLGSESNESKSLKGLAYPIRDSLATLVADWKSILAEPFFGANLSAGVTVAAVALPLNLALALAAGLPATSGLVAGAIGGVFAALFGGSRFQATGPAAALNALVFAIVSQYGAGGAMAAALIVGIVQVLLSVFSAGTLVKYVPEAVLLGFTSGVGIKLLDSQIPKLFGIEWTLYEMVSHIAMPIWLHEVAWPAVVCGLFVVFLILACRGMPRFPAALVSIIVMTQLAIFMDWSIPRVGEIPPLALTLSLPNFDLNQWLGLIQLGLPLGLLAAAESVLSAQAVDRMSGDRHHSNLEILGQGIGNLAAGLAGGMPVSGVIVRSTVNVQSGAKNRLASMFHALILLVSALFMGGMLASIPIAALAGLLAIIGFRLIEFSELLHLIQKNKWLALSFLAAAVGTVTDQIVFGLAGGMVIAWVASREKKPKVGEVNPVKSFDFEELKLDASQLPTAGVMYKVLNRGERWLQHLKQQATVPNTAYIHPNASVIGRVVLGRNVHIAAEASVRADEGTPFYIGDDTNVQDGVVIHALKQKWIKVHNQQWAVYIGKGVSLAHQALIHGPSYIGDATFIGFKAVVHDSIVGRGCYVGIGAVVVGVEIPDERYVPHGAIIDTKERALALLKVSSSHKHFNEDVVEVNKGLALAYRELNLEQANQI
jgi:SulP family sulfate permease